MRGVEGASLAQRFPTGGKERRMRWCFGELQRRRLLGVGNLRVCEAPGLILEIPLSRPRLSL